MPTTTSAPPDFTPTGRVHLAATPTYRELAAAAALAWERPPQVWPLVLLALSVPVLSVLGVGPAEAWARAIRPEQVALLLVAAAGPAYRAAFTRTTWWRTRSARPPGPAAVAWDERWLAFENDGRVVRHRWADVQRILSKGEVLVLPITSALTPAVISLRGLRRSEPARLVAVLRAHVTPQAEAVRPRGRAFEVVT